MTLGLLETPFLSITAVACDTALKAAHVELLGLEPIGTEVILSRFVGDAGAIRAALDAATRRVRQLGSTVVSTSILDAPSPGIAPALSGPNSINPLYGGREYFLPTDHQRKKSTMTPPAIGILETQGLAAILYATDAMLKAADVELVGKEKIGAAYVTIIIKGDVAAVTAALEAGAQAIGERGKLIAAETIARPHGDLLKLLPG
ncbi:MAG: BMC domain-containing protein [Chthoniobacterales bacterium]